MPDEKEPIVEEENKEYEDAFAEFADERDGVDPEPDPEHGSEPELDPEPDPEPEPETDPDPDPDPDPEPTVEELQAENQRLSHQNKSAHGRISALTRKNTDLEGKIAQAAAIDTAPPDEETPDEDWEQLEETFPEIASAVSKKLATVEQTVDAKMDPLVTANAERVEAETSEKEQEQLGVLDKAHPDWRKTIRTKEFEDWYFTQPQSTQDLYRSEEGADGVNLLNLFGARPGADAGKDAVAEAARKVADLKEKKKKQLSSGRTVQTRTRGQRLDTDSGTFESEFDLFAKQKDKLRQRQAAGNHHY